VKAPEIRLDLEALKANFEELSRPQQVSQKFLPLMPVVKADAYGHGAVLISKALEEAFAEDRMPYLCVARWAEAIELRTAGVKRPVLILSQYTAAEIRQASVGNIALLVATEQDLKALESLQASERRMISAVHVHFNTGMNRLGFSPEMSKAELEKIFARLAVLGLKIEGLSTHLARAEEDPALLTDSQKKRFCAAVANAKSVWLETWGEFPKWIHAANSAGILRNLGHEMTAGRPGIFLWGVHQDHDSGERLKKEFPSLKLRPVLSLRCAVREIFWLEKGDGVSYGHRYVAPSRRLVGILNFGYADGLSRSLSRREGEASLLRFWIEGFAAPILGTVTMDMVMIDLTDHPAAAVLQDKLRTGEETIWAEWIGREQPTERHASVLGTITYEILCDLSRRVKREVLNA